MDTSYAKQLYELMTAYKHDPHRLIWKEVFEIIHRMKGEGNPLYRLNPVGEVEYHAAKRIFVIRVPDLNIHLKDYELVDAIVTRRIFLPHLEEQEEFLQLHA